ncbi:PREDICTED: prostaglandin reductase 1-like [Nicrophorus vespilloides]|uniref:Prostaglandin reductase 1 n=1 Tax=Nicrophorus vespilloides TaxID=110193 RepID=A0ABM1MUL1_NICVS|nr:PREDICTED: prostaglandin reductase 1-like [Nicrophorus vespilloides]
MVKTLRYVLKKPSVGMPREEDFQLLEENLPQIELGEFLCKAIYLSVDPYMRFFTSCVGSTIVGTQVAKVIESLNDQFPVGCHVIGDFGWRTYTIVNSLTENLSPFCRPTYVLDELPNHPLSLYLGSLGLTGNTAYFGLTEICQPKAGETIVVTGAAGAVGSHVGQIAKIKGCRVIGITGSKEKVDWLKTLGFDHVLNYNETNNLNAALAEAAPYGIDCYFDNVGGEISSIIMKNMAQYGRVVVCGSISSYNTDSTNLPKATLVQPLMLYKELKLEAFLVSRFNDRWIEGIRQNLQWLDNGQLQFRETIYNGFESMPNAFIGLFKGENIGKTIIQI